MFDVQRFIQTIDRKTLILIDHAYLSAEFERYHSFYSELYSGEDPEMPQKVLPSQLDASDLIEALCTYGNARREVSSVFVFRRHVEPDIISPSTMLETVICTEPTWAEMGRTIEAFPAAKRIILVADSPQYSTLLNMLKTRDYDVCVIKHKQEEDDDWSHMPPDMPYQYSYYIIGEAMGLSRGEL
jgi:hypothetical protein